MMCQMCEICNFEGFCEYTKDNQIVCETCCIDEKKFQACDISNDNLPVVAEIQNLLDKMLSGKEVAVVVKVIGVANNIGGRIVDGYASMLVVAFIDNVLVKCIVVHVHDDTFKGFDHKIQNEGGSNTIQLAYYDTIRLEGEDRAFVNHAVLGAVLIGLSNHFSSKSIHFWMCSNEENDDYLLFGSFWQRQRGRDFPSDRDEAQKRLVNFYESFFDFLLKHFPRLGLEKTNQWTLIQSIRDGEAIESKMYPSKNIQIHFGDALSKLAEGHNRGKFRKLYVHELKYLPPTLVEQPEFQKTLKDETFVICIKNVTPRSLVPRPRVPTRCSLSIPSLDKDGIIGQSIANGVDFSSMQSAKEASNLLLRYLFTGIYQ